MRGQGMLPCRPMPSRGCVCVGVRMGVVATMRVRGGVGVWGGILGGFEHVASFFGFCWVWMVSFLFELDWSCGGGGCCLEVWRFSSEVIDIDIGFSLSAPRTVKNLGYAGHLQVFIKWNKGYHTIYNRAQILRSTYNAMHKKKKKKTKRRNQRHNHSTTQNRAIISPASITHPPQ